MVTVAPSLFPDTFTADLDGMLLQICEELQLSQAMHDLATERYGAVSAALENTGSPFRQLRPAIYPQGSMALGTTVKPIMGSHDLDFVLELSLNHQVVDPMQLIETLYRFLREGGVYGPMTSLKNRCVRIEYANEFYMDIMPACRNASSDAGCIKVPDRSLKGWTDSNPRGYAGWFGGRCRILFVDRILDKAAPVPQQQAVSEKETLKLAVQLLKRWRDWHYVQDCELAPISVVLTTLAGHTYRGQRSVSDAMTSILSGIVGLIEACRQAGQRRLRVLNPSNLAEDLSERWDSNIGAYRAFEEGIRDFHQRWTRVLLGRQGAYAELEMLFGEPFRTVLKKRAKKLQSLRDDGKLGVTRTGGIVAGGSPAAPIRPNTFHGEQ